jgi:hypothetical protein
MHFADEVNRVAKVTPCTIWLWHSLSKVYSPVDCTYRDTISSSDAKMSRTIVAFFLHVLHWRLMSLLPNHHNISLSYRQRCKWLSKSMMPLDSEFSISITQRNFQHVGIHPAVNLKSLCSLVPIHCIISWWLMHCPQWGPSEMNDMNCLLIALESRKWNCYSIELNVFSIGKTTEILFIINVVFEVSKSLETPNTVILQLPCWHWTPLM